MPSHAVQKYHYIKEIKEVIPNPDEIGVKESKIKIAPPDLVGIAMTKGEYEIQFTRRIWFKTFTKNREK